MGLSVWQVIFAYYPVDSLASLKHGVRQQNSYPGAVGRSHIYIYTARHYFKRPCLHHHSRMIGSIYLQKSCSVTPRSSWMKTILNEMCDGCINTSQRRKASIWIRSVRLTREWRIKLTLTLSYPLSEAGCMSPWGNSALIIPQGGPKDCKLRESRKSKFFLN